MKTPRQEVICDGVDDLVARLKLLRGLVLKKKHVDQSEFNSLQVMLSSIRHNVEMNNQERLTAK